MSALGLMNSVLAPQLGSTRGAGRRLDDGRARRNALRQRRNEQLAARQFSREQAEDAANRRLQLENAQAANRERQMMMGANLDLISRQAELRERFRQAMAFAKDDREREAIQRQFQAQMAGLERAEKARQFDTGLEFDREKLGQQNEQFYSGLNEDARQFDVGTKQRDDQFRGQQQFKYDSLGEDVRQFNQDFDQRASQFDRRQRLDYDLLNEDRRQFQAGQSQAQSQFEARQGLDYDRLGEDQRQFDTYQKYRQDVFDEERTAATKDMVGRIEQELSNAQMTPTGQSIQGELLSSLQAIRKAEPGLRPGRVAEAYAQWIDRAQQSQFRNYFAHPTNIEGELGFQMGPDGSLVPTGRMGSRGGTIEGTGQIIFKQPDGKYEVRMVDPRVAEQAKAAASGKSAETTAPQGRFRDKDGRIDSAAYQETFEATRQQMMEEWARSKGFVEQGGSYYSSQDAAKPEVFSVSPADVRRRMLLKELEAEAYEQGPGVILEALKAGQIDPNAVREELGYDVVLRSTGPEDADGQRQDG